MAKQFLDLTGLSTFLTQLKELFATKGALLEVKERTDPYILDIDYTVLEFDTAMIIPEEADTND